VQALVILSATEAAFTRDARGWLYSGMAVRLSADLGLHLDPSEDLAEGAVSKRELDVRRTTFWGTFVHDSMWALYVGRAGSINVRDIEVGRPSGGVDRVRGRRWTPGSPSGAEGQGQGQEDGADYFDPVETCADANVGLCIMMRQLSQTVYSDKTISDEALCEFAASMREQFTAWQESLPPELQVDVHDEKGEVFYLPHVLQLHMQFYAISILLHRPFISRSLKHGSPSSRITAAPAEQPREICINASQSIVSLLRIYRRTHTLRRCNVHIVHLIFTAALICIYSAYSSVGEAARRSLSHLQICCQALGEIGEAYLNANRALEVVICIKREWGSKMMRRAAGAKRRSPSMLRGGEARKRRLTAGGEDRGLGQGMVLGGMRGGWAT
jgi:hypothetical protein